jgi:replication factor C small subunit
MNDLWCEKYRPHSIKDYVFKNAEQKRLIDKWLKEGVLPHILLSGSPGTGKTTLAKVLFEELKISPFDIKEINASKDNGVDYIRDTITRFVETMGVGSMRYVLLDEADYLSPNAQSVLRHTMEKYSATSRFILTCNYPHKIIPAVQSRTEAGRIHIDSLDRDEYTLKLCNILITENIEFNMDTVDSIVNSTYPDLRRGINKIQASCFDGVLTPTEDSQQVADYMIDMLALFKAGQYRQARELICSQVSSEEYEDIYRFMYKNLEIWADSEEKQNKCIIAIRDGLVKHTSCADIEINLSATLVELEMISKEFL